jgi:hypothetical protein
LFPGMYEYCPECSLKFEREAGYFLGAMYIGYGLALATVAIFSVFVWLLFRWSIPKSVIVGLLLFLPFTPLLTVMARVLWIYLDQAIDPDRD